MNYLNIDNCISTSHNNLRKEKYVLHKKNNSISEIKFHDPFEKVDKGKENFDKVSHDNHLLLSNNSDELIYSTPESFIERCPKIDSLFSKEEEITIAKTDDMKSAELKRLGDSYSNINHLSLKNNLDRALSLDFSKLNNVGTGRSKKSRENTVTHSFNGGSTLKTLPSPMLWVERIQSMENLAVPYFSKTVDNKVMSLNNINTLNDVNYLSNLSKNPIQPYCLERKDLVHFAKINERFDKHFTCESPKTSCYNTFNISKLENSHNFSLNNNEDLLSPTDSNSSSIDLPIVLDCECKVKHETFVKIAQEEIIGDVVVKNAKTKKFYNIQTIFTDPFAKIFYICRALLQNSSVLLKRGFKILLSITNLLSHQKTVSSTELAGIIQCENEKILYTLNNNLSSLSSEMNQIKMTNEGTFKSLLHEFKQMRSDNAKLLEKNNKLSEEMRSLHEAVANLKSTSSGPVKSANLSMAIPPPPPPPPPPMPTFNSNSLYTPKSNLSKLSSKCQKNKKSPVQDRRPNITVEDLLKVTLRKAPQNNKENRRNTIHGSNVKGPVVSVEMLQNIKLKSVRRRSSNDKLSLSSSRNSLAL